MGSASLLVLGMVAAAPAFAADAPAAVDESVVVVTGQRAQLKSAQKIKKDAETVVDSITSTDIGALPDRSVSEALQRVVGVTLQRTDQAHDPARLSGEGGAIFIRGLSYVSTFLNGREVFAASNGRTIGFEDVSADLMSRVDVYKGNVSDQIEGQLGGIVDLRTRLPFDSKKRVLAFTLDGNHGDLSKKTFYSGSLTYSDRWNTNVGEVGLLLNYSLSNVGTRSNSLSADRFDAVSGPRAGTGTCLTGDKCVPKFLGYRVIDWEQKREAAAAALQWRPADDMLITLQYLNTKASPKSTERATGISDNILKANNPTYVYNSNNQFVGGIVDNASLYNDTRTGDDHKDTTDTALSFRYTPSEKIILSGEFQYVRSDAKIVSFTVGTNSFDVNNNSPNPLSATGGISDVVVDLTTKLPSFTFYNPNYFCFPVGPATSNYPACATATPVAANKQINTGLSNPANFYYQFAMDHLEHNSANESTARIDLEYDFDSDWLKSLKVGARTTDKLSITRQNGYNWGAVSNDGAWAGSTNQINNDPPLPKGEFFAFDNFFHGDAVATGSWFPTAALAAYTPANKAALQAAGASLGWGWTPFNGDFSAVDYGRPDNASSGILNQTEKTAALYGVVRFGNDSFLGSGKALDGNIGVRVVKTELDNGTGKIINPGLIDTSTIHVDTSQSAAQQKVYNDAIAISQTGGAKTGIAYHNTYTDTLPSLNLRLHWNDQLQFRFGISKAIVRPTFAQMSPYTNLIISTTNAGGFFTSVSYTGTAGNPNLKPMTSNSYDLSGEWYFSPTGSLTLALFNKDLKNYFLGTNVNEDYTVGGITKTYSVFRTQNGSKGKVSGAEIAYQQFYDFLPSFWSGFGVQANYTLVNSKGGGNTPVSATDPDSKTGAANPNLPLEGLSKNSYNLALMYEKYGFSGRIAYNWRSNYLLTTSAANVKAPIWSEDYGQADASLLYSVTPQVKVGMQVTNLFKAKTYLQVGNPGLLNRYNWFLTDQRVAFVVRGAF
jgi:TonB-dependent receptor